MDERQLQNEETWDYSKAEKRAGVRKRTVVSVAFSREDFERVAARAEQLGMKISEYIRNAAIQAAENRPHVVTFISGSLGGVLQARDFAPSTNSQAPRVVIESEEARSVTW